MNPFLVVVACGLSFCLPTADGAAVANASDFVVQAELVEALQGGPLIVKVTLLYQGDEARKVDQSAIRSNLGLEVPEGWDFVPRARGVSGPIRVVRTIAKGDRWTQTVFLHHQYANIASGKATLKVRWTLIAADGKPLIAPAAATLNIDIPAATKERVRDLCKRLEAKLDGDRGEEVVREVIDYIRYTKHAGLAPVAWRLIESPAGVYSIDDFLKMVYDATEKKGAVNRRLVKLARDPDYPQMGELFWYWRRQRVDVSAEEMAPLLQSKNLWTKALTYASFGDRCGKEWTEQFLHDFREAHAPIPVALFKRLVAGLDDNDYAAREKAMRELRQYGARGKVQYLEAIERAPAPEAKRRMELLLGDIPQDVPPIARTTFWLVRNAEDVPGRTLLHMLAEGQTDSWATREAKARLAEEGKE